MANAIRIHTQNVTGQGRGGCQPTKPPLTPTPSPRRGEGVFAATGFRLCRPGRWLRPYKFLRRQPETRPADFPPGCSGPDHFLAIGTMNHYYQNSSEPCPEVSGPRAAPARKVQGSHARACGPPVKPEREEIVIMAGSAHPTGNFSEPNSRSDCSTENRKLLAAG